MANKKTKKPPMSTKKRNIIIASCLGTAIAASVAIPIPIAIALAPVDYSDVFAIENVESQEIEFSTKTLSTKEVDGVKVFDDFSITIGMKFAKENSNKWLTGARYFDGQWEQTISIATGSASSYVVGDIKSNNPNGTYLQSITLNFSNLPVDGVEELYVGFTHTLTILSLDDGSTKEITDLLESDYKITFIR